jgi:hypothetical protein
MKVFHTYTKWEYGFLDFVIFSRGKEVTEWEEDKDDSKPLG